MKCPECTGELERIDIWYRCAKCDIMWTIRTREDVLKTLKAIDGIIPFDKLVEADKKAAEVFRSIGR